MIWMTEERLRRLSDGFAGMVAHLFAKKTEIPKRVSELENDEGYAKAERDRKSVV